MERLEDLDDVKNWIAAHTATCEECKRRDRDDAKRLARERAQMAQRLAALEKRIYLLAVLISGAGAALTKWLG